MIESSRAVCPVTWLAITEREKILVTLAALKLQI
jgi:hypothetical protein